MTKTAFLVSVMVLAAAGQVAAGEMPSSGPQNAGASNPCLLGNAPDKTACAGMIRVAPSMTVQSRTYSSSFSQGPSPIVLFDPNHGYSAVATPEAEPAPTDGGATASAPHQQTMTVTCDAPQAGANVTCRGYRVPAVHGQTGQLTQSPMMVHPEFLPQPERVMSLPPLASMSQTTLPPPMLPPVPCCQQQEVTLIPASFFMGAMSYGVGFPTATSYSYTGGNYAFVASGTRFSGVRDPVHLAPPPHRHRNPRPKPCGCH